MSGARADGRGEERLLELLLSRSPESERELSQLRRDPRVAADVEALDAFLDTCRERLEVPVETRQAEAVVERVLARTSREDLSIGGDLRLLRGFVHERLRASVVLRLVAASLLVHVMALPVLAWVLLVQEPKGPLITFEPPHPPAVEDAEEPAIELSGETVELEDLLGEPIPAGDAQAFADEDR
jgi:hypothetical protein